jgi:hypothetical protein
MEKGMEKQNRTHSCRVAIQRKRFYGVFPYSTGEGGTPFPKKKPNLFRFGFFVEGLSD